MPIRPVGGSAAPKGRCEFSQFDQSRLLDRRSLVRYPCSPFGTCVDDLPLRPALPAKLTLSGKAGCEPERRSYWLRPLGPGAELLTDARTSWGSNCSRRIVRETAAVRCGKHFTERNALYSPVWTTSVTSPGSFGVALVGFVLLTVWEAPPLVVVVVSAIGGVVLAVATT